MAPKKGSIPWNKGLVGCQKGWNKGVPMTNSAKQKLSESLKGRIPWNKGVLMTDEVKEKVSTSCKKHWADADNLKILSDSHLGQTAWCKGLSMPDEVKKKISRTKKSQKLKHSAEHKRKISEGQMGKKNQFYGKRHSDETKRIISSKVSGEKSPRWKGGIACEPYCDVWLDKEFKEDIKERDNSKCQSAICSGKSKMLCIHHINYIKKDCHPSNLITVCMSCNARANSKRPYWTQFYNDIMFYNQRLMHEQSLLKAIRVS